MFIPNDTESKTAWINLAVQGALAAAPAVIGAMSGGSKKPTKPANPMAGPSMAGPKLAAMQTAGGSPDAATAPQGSVAAPKSPELTHTPGSGDMPFSSANYSQPAPPTIKSPPKLMQSKKSAVNLDTTINAAAALTPVLYDMGRHGRDKRNAENDEIEHLEGQMAQSKTRTAGLNPIPMVSNYVEGMGNAGLDALTEEQRVRESAKHLPTLNVKRTQV